MNKVTHLANLIGGSHGGQAAIANICEIDKSNLTFWKQAGRIPVKYNHRLKAFIAGSPTTTEWKLEALSCLEPDNCPMCGQELNGRVI